MPKLALNSLAVANYEVACSVPPKKGCRMSIYPAIMLLAAGLAATATQAKPVQGMPIDESYRLQFTACDATDRFEGVQFPIRKANGKVAWFGCHSDPSRFARFERVKAQAGVPEAIIWESKIARDDDGSPKACDNAGPTDQCPTTLMLKPTPAQPCPKSLEDRGPKCLPVNAATIPYAVIPAAAPRGIDSARFMRLTGLKMGDVGMVVRGDKQVPAILADTGPAYKIGEGSAALLGQLSANGNPRTWSSGVQFIFFPRSAPPESLSADDLAAYVKDHAAVLYRRLEASSR